MRPSSMSSFPTTLLPTGLTPAVLILDYARGGPYTGLDYPHSIPLSTWPVFTCLNLLLYSDFW